MPTTSAIVIDQFPASLLRRHEARFSSGRFRRLLARGASYEQAQYPHPPR